MRYTLNGNTYVTDPSIEIKENDWCICSYYGIKVVCNINKDYPTDGKENYEKIIQTDAKFLNVFGNIKSLE